MWIVNNVIVNKQQRSEYNQPCVKILAKKIDAKMCKNHKEKCVKAYKQIHVVKL